MLLYTKYIILVIFINSMKLSTKGRYGTRALLDIALHPGDRPVVLRDIARRQQISALYLDRLIAPLIAAGIIRSIRGAKGGVSLAKLPEEIRLIEVIETLEGPINPVDCVNKPELCKRSRSCVTREVWDEVKEAIKGVLENITLKDLVERQKSKEQSREQMYYI
jgi:Rrf2 family protein